MLKMNLFILAMVAVAPAPTSAPAQALILGASGPAAQTASQAVSRSNGKATADLANTPVIQQADGLQSTSHTPGELRTRTRYVLHAGDVLELNYRLSPEFNQTVAIEPDGHASLNIAGDMLLSGLTLEAARKRILTADAIRLNQPELNLVLKEFQKPYIVVGGEVNAPGKIELRQDMTAIQAMLLAGGPKTSARTSKVALFRHLNDEYGEVRILDLAHLSKSTDLERDMRLEPGDMLFIPNSRMDKFEHFMRAANFGMYLNPLQF